MRRFLAVVATLAMTFGITTVHAAEVEGVPAVTDSEEQTRIRMQSCALDRADARETLVAKDIFVDHRFLPVLLGRALDGLTDGWPYAYDSRVVMYMLQTGWTGLETQKGFSTVTDLPSTTPVLRFEVMPEGSAACKNWSKQYESPLSAIPGLRELGVSPDQCIGVSELPSPSAEGRITVQRTRLYYDPAILTSYTWRLDVRAGVIGPNSQLTESANVTMHLHQADIGQHGSSNLWSACHDRGNADSGHQAAVIAASLTPDSSGTLRRRPTVVREAVEQPLYEPLSDKQLEGYQWLKSAGSIGQETSFYGIDKRGTVWTERLPERFPSWSIKVAQADRILRATIPSDWPRDFYSTLGFAATATHGYAVVLRLNRGRDIRLFEYDHDLQLIKAYTLTLEQLDRVLPLTL